MPNELKNALNASTQISETKKSPQLGSSTISMMLWTISGIALAACSGGTRVVTRDGDGTGGTVFVPQAAGGPVVRVVDGPIKGAAVYFDLDGDGVVSAAERAAQTDASGRPFYVTDENGQAQIPEAYEGVHFVADVNGAFDTSTGERLAGEFQSLSAGGIASPLTDLLNQVERDGGSAQGTLDEIFGMDAEGNSEVTIADVLNYENYGILSSSPSALTAPTPPVAPTAPPPGSADSSLYLADLAAYQASLLQYEADLAAYQANLANILIEFITRASLAITEIDQDSTLVTSGGAADTTENRIAVLKALFDGDPSNDNAALSTLIANREAIGRQILDGKPVAAPDPHVNIEEDGVFNAADYDHGGDNERANIESLFGFIDPGQNAANEVISAFRGIYVKGTVDNADLTFGGTALTSSLTTTGDGVPSNTPSESGFYYVSFGHLSTMSISPDANYHGSLELEYYVFDGIDWSEKATLEINVRSVNDAPTFTGLSGDRNSDPAIAQYVLSTDGQVILADGTLEGLIQGLNDVEDANDDLTFTIGGPDGDLFRVVGDNASGFRLELIDPSTAKIAGATYQITITVTDTEGLDSATQSFTLTQGGFYLENTGLRTYSNGAALIDEEQDASATPIVLGTIGVEGLNTAEVGTAGTEGYKSTVTFTTDTPDFDILNGQLRFTGSDSGDFESDESLTVNVKASYYTIVEQVADFTGQKDVQADGLNSGDQGDVDARTFSYNGGAVSFVTRGDFDENGDAFASVNIASGVIYVPHQGTDIPAKSITFEAVEGLQYGANGFIIVNGDGVVSFAETLPQTGEYYVLARVSEPTVTAAVPLVEGTGKYFLQVYTDSVTPINVIINFAADNGADVAAIVSEDVGANTVNIISGITGGVYNTFAEMIALVEQAIQNGDITLLTRIEFETGNSSGVDVNDELKGGSSISPNTITTTPAVPAVPQSARANDIVQNTGTEVTTPEALLVHEYTNTEYEYRINIENIDDNGPVFSSPNLDDLEPATAEFTAGDPIIAGSSPVAYGTAASGGSVTVEGITFTSESLTDVEIVITLSDPSAGAVATSVTETGSTITIVVGNDGTDLASVADIVTAITDAITANTITLLTGASGTGTSAPAAATGTVPAFVPAVVGSPAAATPEGGVADIIFTTKAVGFDANTYEIEFAIGSSGSGVEGVLLNGKLITITLHADGATLDQIKAAVEGDGTLSPLVTVTIAEGKGSASIYNAISATAFTGATSGAVEFAEDVSDSTVLYTVSATDADGDVVTYTLDATSATMFDINARGEISLKDGMNFDFETATIHNIVVTATSTFTGQTPKTATVPIQITITNVNEAPETPVISNQIAITDSGLQASLASTTPLVVATVAATDPDNAGANPNADSVTYAVTGGTHASLFEMQGGDLVFTGTAADFLNPGQQYEVIVTATDEGGLTSQETILITQGGVYIETGTAPATVRTYTNGDALLPEELDTENHSSAPSINVNGSSVGGFLLGDLGDHSGSTTFTTSTTGFAILNNKLYYIGSDSGDFENGDQLTVEIVGTDAGGTSVTYTYIVNLSNVDDNDPGLDNIQASTDVVLTGDQASGPTLTLTENGVLDLATMVGTDADEDTVTYRLDPSYGDNALFDIDAATGQLRFKAGQNNFEHQDATAGLFDVRVTLVSTSSLPTATGGSASEKTSDVDLKIQLTDINEAPTAITISRAALVGGSAQVGTLGAVDPDDAGTNPAAFTFALTANANTDNALFSIVNGELVFVGTDPNADASTTGVNGRKQLGEVYEVELSVTDGEFTYTQTLIIAEGSVYLEPTAGVKRYSSYADADGDGLLDENKDGTGTPVNFGMLKSETPDAKLGLAPTSNINDNDKFQINGSGELEYIGSDSGNFEDGDALIVEVAFLGDASSSSTEYTVGSGEYVYKSNFLPTGSTDEHYFKSSVDLSSARHGVVGTSDISITLLRADGEIAITGTIPNLKASGHEEDYYVWAVRNGQTWSLTATVSNPSGRPSGDEFVLLYRVSETGSAGSITFDLRNTTVVADGTKFTVTELVTKTVTADNDVFIYQVDPDNTANNGDEYYIQTHHDLTNDGSDFRAGAPGNGPITVTIFRDSAPSIKIVGEVENLYSNWQDEYHNVWAVKSSAGVWSLVSTNNVNLASAPTGYAETIYLYTLSDIAGGSGYNVLRANRVTDNTDVTFVPPAEQHVQKIFAVRVDDSGFFYEGTNVLKQQGGILHFKSNVDLSPVDFNDAFHEAADAQAAGNIAGIDTAMTITFYRDGVETPLVVSGTINGIPANTDQYFNVYAMRDGGTWTFEAVEASDVGDDVGTRPTNGEEFIFLYLLKGHSDADGKFYVTGPIRLENGDVFEHGAGGYEKQPSIESKEVYTIRLGDVNDAPEITVDLSATNEAGDNLGTVEEGGSLTLTTALLSITDEDAADNLVDDNGNRAANGDEMVITVVSTAKGTVYLNGNALNDGDTFTLTQLRAGQVTFTHDGSEQFDIDADGYATTTPDLTNIVLKVADGDGAESAETTVNLTVTAVDDKPVLARNDATTLNEGATVTITEAASLKFTDADNPRSEVVYVLTEIPEHGALKLNGTTLASGSSFTQDDINSGRLTYEHDGSENHGDGFKFRVENQNSDGDPLTTAEDGNGNTVFTHTFTITPVNDAPSFTPAVDYAKDYAAANSPTVADLEVTASELDEGGNAIINVDDIGFFDPDDDDANIHIVFTQLILDGGSATSTVTLQKNTDTTGNNPTWVDISLNDRISLADIKTGHVRIIHNGDAPTSADDFKFKVKAVDDSNAETAEKEVTVDVKPINDAPTAMVLTSSRIDPAAHTSNTAADREIGIQTTDEETTDQSQFTYTLVGSGNDNAYFQIQNNKLVLLQSLPGGLIHKQDGEEYRVEIQVTDTGLPGHDADEDTDKDPVSIIRVFTIPVRSFDIDWNDNGPSDNDIQSYFDVDKDSTTPGVQTLDIDLGGANAFTTTYDIGTFTVKNFLLAGENINQYTLSVIAPTLSEYGTVTVTPVAGSADKFRITFRASQNDILNALEEGEKLSINFGLEVRVKKTSDPDSSGFKRSIESFDVTFTGTNQTPDDPTKFIADESNLAKIISGLWIFNDQDGENQLAEFGLLASTGAGSTPTALTGLNVGNVDPANVGSVTISGTYGTFTIYADRRWTYQLDADDAQQVPVTGAQEVLRIQTQDVRGGVSAIGTYTIDIRGENDNPTLTVDQGTSLVEKEVTETTSSGTDNSQLTQAAGQSVEGQYLAADVDAGAVLRLFVGADEVGQVPSSGNSITYEGIYGDIVFNGAGRWTYTLNARAEKIAAGEKPIETFNITIMDQYLAVSNRVTIEITVVGTNDAPTALLRSFTGGTQEVIESGFRVDTGHNYDLANGDTDDDAIPTQSADTTIEENTEGGSNDVLGRTGISGTFDAADIDVVGTANVAAADLHSFEVLGGSGVTTRDAAVELTKGGTTISDTDTDYGFNLSGKAVDAAPDNILSTFKGVYGTLSVNRFTGDWTYTLDNHDADTVALDAGDRVNDIFSILITDEEGATHREDFTVVVVGTNDAPLLEVDNPSNQDFVATELGGTNNSFGGAVAYADTSRFIYEVPTTHGGSDKHLIQTSFDLNKGNWIDGWITDNLITITLIRNTESIKITGPITGSASTYSDLEQALYAVNNGGVWSLVSVTAGRSNVTPPNGDEVIFLFDFYGNDVGRQYQTHSHYNQLTRITDGRQLPSLAVEDHASGKFTVSDDDADDTVLDGTNLIVQAKADTSRPENPAVVGDSPFTPSGSYANGGNSGKGTMIQGAYGKLYLKTDGTWTYEVDNGEAHVDALKSGETVNDVFTFRVENKGIHSNLSTITLTVNGANDNPVLASQFTASTDSEVVEGADGSNTVTGTPETDQTVSGALTMTDEDRGQDQSTLRVFVKVGRTADGAVDNTNSSVGVGATETFAGGNGTFTVVRASDGSVTWRYELDDSNTDTNALHDGQIAWNYLQIILYDADNLASNIHEIAVKITGTNDQPILSALAGPAVITDNGSSDTGSTFTGLLSGSFVGSDVDNGDVLTYKVVGANAATPDTGPGGSYTHRINGDYGTLYFNQNSGLYIYVRDEAAINALDAGDTPDDTFTVSVLDQRGKANSESDTQQLVFNFVGANDAPKLTGSASRTIDEDTTSTPNITFEFSDPDADDTNPTLRFWVAAEGQPNTAPADAALADTSSISFGNGTLGDYGRFTFSLNNNTGRVIATYTLDNSNSDVAGLGTGDRLFEKFTLYIGDHDDRDSGKVSPAQTFVVQILGVNDLPEISLASGQDATPDVTEEETGTVSAIFDFSDVDTADTNAALEIRIAHAHSDAGIPSNANFASATNTNPTSITGEYGVFSITKNNGTGKLTVTYDLNEAASNVQSLGQGQQVYEKLTIFVYDGEGNSTPQTFTVTITGANDLPQLSLASGQNNAPTMTEESTGTFSAEYDFSDVDANDTNASLQIKIAHAHSTSGVPATDSIGDASHTNPTSITGQYGTFTITKNNGTGKVSVTYDLDQSSSAVQGLREGATVYEKLTIFVDDGDGNSTPQTFTVSITGTNDQPVLNDITGLTIVDDPNTAANSSPADPGAIDGSLGHSDTDSGDSHEYKTTDTEAPQSNSNAFRVDKTYTYVWFNRSNGDYNIIRNESEINKLGAGESVTETYTLYVEDNSGASNSASATKTLVITINGRNDKPTLGSVTSAGSVNENAAGANIGAIRFTPADEDQNQGTFVASDFTLEANGGGLTNQQVNNLFEVVSLGGGAFGLKLKSGQQLNYENKSSYAIKVKVGDDHGGESSFVNLTVNVTNVDETDATVSIARSSGSGSAREGHVYRATVTNDLDGATAYGFQWYRDGVAISGETGQTYTLVGADGGTDLTVRISYTDASFGPKTATSNTVTLPVFNSPPTGSITSNLGSQHDIGDTVTITDTVTDPDGIPSSGAGAKTYTVYYSSDTFGNLAALEASSNKASITVTGATFNLPKEAFEKQIYVVLTYTDEASTPRETKVFQNLGYFDAGDTWQTAIDIADVIAGNKVVGFQHSGDADFYKFTVSERSLVTFTETDNINTSVTYRIFNSSGTRIGNSFYFTGSNTAINQLAIVLVAGTYYFEIVNAGYTGAYAFTYETQKDVGDTAATAEAITDVISGNEVAGSIDVSGDVDVYSFTLTDRKLVTFTEIGTTSNDILFRLVNSSDVEQAPAPTTSGGVTTLTTTLDAGTYYVKVSGTGTFDYRFTFVETDPPIFTIPTTVKSGGTAGQDTITGTTADEVIQGGNDNDTITTGGGDDLVIGGYGNDTITLNSGAETVLYRFESDSDVNGNWKATDGGDIINNFKRGTDKLVLIDTSGDGNPIDDFAEFIADSGKPTVNITVGSTSNAGKILSVEIVFSASGTANGPAGGAPRGSSITINFDTTGDLVTYADNTASFSVLQLSDYNFLDDLFGAGSLFVVDDSASEVSSLTIL